MSYSNSKSSLKTLLMVDCDERTEAMLTKSIKRLGMGTKAAHKDDVTLEPNIVGLIIELDHFKSPELVKIAEQSGMPIIALTSHETLSQVQAAVRLGATAMLNKPFTQSAVYTTFMMAQGLAERIRSLTLENGELSEIKRRRPEIAKAVASLMIAKGIDEHEAFGALRSLSMSLNISIDSICEDIDRYFALQSYRKQ